jgi:hypothetical protein
MLIHRSVRLELSLFFKLIYARLCYFFTTYLLLFNVQLMDINENPIYVLLNPAIIHSQKDLPISIYETGKFYVFFPLPFFPFFPFLGNLLSDIIISQLKRAACY